MDISTDKRLFVVVIGENYPHIFKTLVTAYIQAIALNDENYVVVSDYGNQFLLPVGTLQIPNPNDLESQLQSNSDFILSLIAHKTKPMGCECAVFAYGNNPDTEDFIGKARRNDIKLTLFRLNVYERHDDDLPF